MLLFNLWGKQKGFVALSSREGGKWKEHFFRWPEEAPKVKELMKRSTESDLYFSWQVYSKPARREENIESVRIIGADCDEASPACFPLPPSVWWESSPRKYHALWLLDESLPPQEAKKLSRLVTERTHSDPGGWDLPQVLRIPGTVNHKYPEKPPVTLREESSRSYGVSELEKYPDVVESILKRHTLSRRFKYLWEKPAEEGERSTDLYALEASALECGLSPEETFLVARACPHNKYRKRKDEGRRLWAEIDKILAHPKVQKAQERPEIILLSWEDVLSREYPTPSWLVDKVWEKGAYGILAGEPKTFKSFLTVDLAFSVASGKPFLGQYEVRSVGPVLMVQEEDRMVTVRDRGMKIACTKGILGGVQERLVEFPPQVPVFFLDNQGFLLDDPRSQDKLENFVDRVKPVLMVLDPLSMMLAQTDENDAAALAVPLMWLKTLSHRYSCAIILVHHYRKMESSRAGQRMRGSTFLHGWVECGLYTRFLEEGNVLLEREFRSFGSQIPLKLSYSIGEPGALEYGVTCTEGGSASKRSAGDKLVAHLQATGPISEVEALAFFGGSFSEMKKAVKRAGDILKVEEGKVVLMI